jgi:hypothetical protein
MTPQLVYSNTPWSSVANSFRTPGSARSAEAPKPPRMKVTISSRPRKVVPGGISVQVQSGAKSAGCGSPRLLRLRELQHPGNDPCGGEVLRSLPGAAQGEPAQPVQARHDGCDQLIRVIAGRLPVGLHLGHQLPHGLRDGTARAWISSSRSGSVAGSLATCWNS